MSSHLSLHWGGSTIPGLNEMEPRTPAGAMPVMSTRSHYLGSSGIRV
jgi:hypothetical protein